MKRTTEDLDYTIFVRSPEGGSTITPEACAEFSNDTCKATCRIVGECSLAKSVALQLENAAESLCPTSPPTYDDVVVLMNANEQGRS